MIYLMENKVNLNCSRKTLPVTFCSYYVTSRIQRLANSVDRDKVAQKGPPHLDFVTLSDNIFVSCIQVVGDEMKAKKVLNDALEIDPVSKSVFFFSIEQPGICYKNYKRNWDILNNYCNCPKIKHSCLTL